ncbi:5'-methylthioadenosine/S-adenosylhomocysteine nucleosidase [Streptomyces ipomoeae]|uniref:5'-methylthioadenosine/S-adenosylhomocysteine nucleosidase n=1 Tax=Streptomyces ipomoeae TaxID=103232 RepID=UPI0029AB49E3|nr:5'-methylthioadenosine/S-adenosylhomocysteine nucleosidase [Streptomyces ipomoeae]MDX2823996.1 5'-methylthioadenosine/S-adenosylhomocysteine nucleosidase [Streptomyces ipomoeae]MDX2876556.1 5'-methylthioadenosine/S-adenosylhomocysteine nucleosidase [Streptomyces ipomoeae]
MSPKPDVVVFTALGKESNAVLDHLDGPLAEHEVRGALFELGGFTGERATWRVACHETGEGNAAAAALVERAVTEFEPRYIFFVGVAGGLKDVKLCDVVAARHIYDYERGKDEEDGFRARITTHLSTFDLVQRAQSVARSDGWRRRIRSPLPDPDLTPNAYVKPLASGSKVVAHERSATAKLLAQHCGDALAVEMEGHGFLQAEYINAGVSALVVRGVSDLLSDKGEDNDTVWQPAASRCAAAFTFEVLAKLPTPPPRRQGLGDSVREIRRTRQSTGQATIGFGPDHTAVVIGGDGSIERWDLKSNEPLPGAPGGAELRLGHQAVASSFRHSVAIARRTSLELVHFVGTSGEHRRHSVPLDRDEFLVTSGGAVVATHDTRRLAVRDFDDGRILRELPCPQGLAASAISADASVAAMATSNRVFVHRPNASTVELDIRNRLGLLKLGCWLGVSPSGRYVACATFRELRVWRIADQSVVLHREFSGQESVDGLGAQGMRLLCTDEGRVLWLRRGLLSQVTDRPEIRHLEQAGRYDDFAVHPDGNLLAAVSATDLVRVWEWNG